jgi:ABC-type bacteriocin/lantibiotic exporter with double-glycine peptidase domain
MDLPSVHIFQESDSNTYGSCCLAMVYALKGKNISLSNILNDFNHPKIGKATYVHQLANHLHKNRVKTKIVTSTSKVLSPAWRDIPKEKIIENLQAWIPVHRKNL